MFDIYGRPLLTIHGPESRDKTKVVQLMNLRILPEYQNNTFQWQNNQLFSNKPTEKIVEKSIRHITMTLSVWLIGSRLQINWLGALL